VRTLISHNFYREEFNCKCACGFNVVDAELLKVMQIIRDHFDQPIRITSGNRCFRYNTEIGGTDKSYHKKGMACDFQVRNIKTELVLEFIDQEFPEKYGVGTYNTFNHLDVRLNKTRWDERSTNG